MWLCSLHSAKFARTQGEESTDVDAPSWPELRLRVKRKVQMMNMGASFLLYPTNDLHSITRAPAASGIFRSTFHLAPELYCLHCAYAFGV